MKAIVRKSSGNKLKVGSDVDRRIDFSDYEFRGANRFDGQIGVKEFESLQELVAYAARGAPEVIRSVGGGIIVYCVEKSDQSSENFGTLSEAIALKQIIEKESPDFFIEIYDSWIE